ncbi:MAG TPA: DNA double-strand break repair nuclease NurA [Armatimonadetes bacterium]|nr:DNA double-strand break repair nuclease NurA [Armatimonadota bacterium]
MLDLAAVKRQLNEMAREQIARRDDFAHRIAEALMELRRWDDSWEQLTAKVARSKTSWLLADLTEQLSARYPAPTPPRPLTVLATDGSQIFPDRHEVALCYLLNIGIVALHYGTGERPILKSQPYLHYREDDLYERWGGRKVLVNPDIVSVRRHLLELETLVGLATECNMDGRPKVALVDGTLILWRLEGMPDDFSTRAVQRLCGALSQLRALSIPIAGYISSPGSTDVVNALRVGLCPYDAPNCDRCEYRDELASAPCAVIEGITDQAIFSRILNRGERTQLFGSASRILEQYGEHRVMFYYVHVGAEVARVEVPLWVARDESLLNLIHSAICDQAEKGNGYPVALSEAHERAVVRGRDRELFYRMLEETFIQHNLRISVSLKMLAKRAPGV